MAFILTPRFAPAYQSQCSPFGFCAPVSRPAYSYRVSRPQPRRPQYSSFNHFFNQVDELLGEIDREAQRQAQLEAHLEAQREAQRQRQQRKRALRAKFTASRNEQGWHVDGDVQGFEPENISIEVTDEQTLKISGNTRWQPEKSQHVDTETTRALDASAQEEPSNEAAKAAQNGNMDGATLNESVPDTVTEAETAAVGVASPDSDTDSHKSYQATVEDDFEDLGADTSSLISASSGTSTPADFKEPKGKEKAVEEPVVAVTAITPQPQPEAPVQQPQEKEAEHERNHGSFEQTFRFPERIDGNNVSASFNDGVLRVTVPRAKIQHIRRIAIL
jgi:HSP20 family molecular chaperone IbpA